MSSERNDGPPPPTAQPLPELSREQARAVIWQAQPKRPMGELLDEGRLTRGDLRWAMQNAYRLDVRAAATLLLAELDQPHAPVTGVPIPAATIPPPVAPLAPTPSPQQPPIAHVAPPATIAPAVSPARDQTGVVAPRYGPRIIEGSTYLADQAETNFGLMGVAIGVTVMFVLYAIGDAAWALINQQPVHSLALVSFVLGVGLGIWFFRKYQRTWHHMQTGRIGEDRIVEALRQALDARWTIYRNLQLPGKRADLDVVLVGPGGVWLVQVKAFKNPVRYANNRWEYQAGRTWKAMNARSNPGKVGGQAAELHDFLARQGVDRWIEKAIAFAEGQPAGNMRDASVAVWMPYNIVEMVQNLKTRYIPSQSDLERINAVLQQRAAELRAVEQARGKRART